MSRMSGIGRLARTLIPALISVFVGASLAPAQTRQILSWQDDLAYLQNAPGDALAQAQAAVVQIRNGVELWLKTHADAHIELRPAPQQPWGEEEIRAEVSALRE
ncbi:MAG: hypothetical protein H6Q06_2415, partial [Acidobacteria bacterium]|nr:hypothetical protein [Acidobacteriota bacterium]